MGCVLGDMFIDMTKAFATVYHDILIDRLCVIGVKGIILNWFCSYLPGHCQCVNIGCTES